MDGLFRLNSRIPVALSLIAATLTFAPAARAAGYKVVPVSGGGSLKGRVYFVGDYPKGKPTVVTKDNQICGNEEPYEEFIVSPENKGLKNAVVRIVTIAAGKPFAKKEVQIEQRQCRYRPHVQVVRTGMVKIINNDNTLHNVHAYFDPEGKRKTLFNFGQPFKGHVFPGKFAEPGIVKLVCDVHPWMNGWVLVVENPYYALTGSDGSFEIDGIPPGQYEVEVWHEGLGSAKKDVLIKAGEATAFDFPIGE